MIELTKINEESILINPSQIECVEMIPEGKIIMMNGKFHIVKEGKDEIKQKVVEFLQLVHSNEEWRG